jgi:beta-galactosidase
MRELYRCLITASFLGAAVAVWAAAPAFAVADELEEDHQLSMEFETPHTDWAQPYALGKVRVLYFGWASYGRGVEARDIIELMQRFDIQAQAAYYHRVIDSPQTEWRGREAGVQRILKLLEQPWDCFLFAGVPVTNLPREAQFKMYKAVTEGAGIVLLGVDDERAFKPQNKITELPPFLARDPVGDAYHIKAGRGIRLPSRPQIAYHPGWQVDYDYWVERVGRAVLWAANKSPRVELSVMRDSPRIERAQAPGKRVTVRWNPATAPQGLKIEARLRSAEGAVFPLAPDSQAPSEAALSFPLARRWPAGQYHVDVIARSKQGVEAWATAPLEITASRSVKAIELSKPWGEIGEKVAGTVALDGAPAAGEKVRVQLLDAHQRVLVQSDWPVTDSAARFEFPIADWMPMLLEVRAVVMDGEEEVSSAYSYFNVTKRSRGHFNFVVWDWPSDTLTPYAEEQLARLGCTVQLGHGAPNLPMAAANVSQIVYTTRIMTTWDDNGYMVPTCWNDEPAVDQWVESIVSPCAASRRHGVFVYSLGDETATKGSCVHPACLAAYRRYLQQEYGDIAALNQSWGSGYASFDEIQLSSPGDNDEAAALHSQAYARWYDRQAFKGYNFVKLCERFGRRFKELDPQALTGFEGAGGFADGTDLDLICRTNGFWSPYPGLQDEVIRSIARRDFIRSNWMGYTKNADPLLGVYWRMVTRGTDSVWWWMWCGFGAYRGLLAPYMAPWKAIKEMARDTQVVRDGLGDLLLRSTRQDDGIAILYSYPSSFATQIEAGPSYGKYEDDHTAWHLALRALGLQFSYVTDRKLRQGEFNARRYKLLILPRAEAIGPGEAAAVRDFAANGGTVIADVRPGIYDHHCKPLPRGLLDDLFGIVRTGNQDTVTADGSISGALGDRSLALPLSGAHVDPGVRADGGKPMGSAGSGPLCIVNQAGRGRAVLLNFTMSSFPAIRDPAAPAAAADFMAALLAAAGVEPAVAVTDAAGRPVRDTEVIRWKGRGVDFLALFGGKDEKVQVSLPRAQHVYDLRERAYLGPQTTFAVHKLPTRATFVALSPVKLPAAQIEPSRERVKRGERLTVRLSYAASRARHAARVRVYGPDGAHAEWFDTVVVIEPLGYSAAQRRAGKPAPPGAEIALPIAHNDPAGVWTIRATDLYTGEVSEARFVVE